MHTFIKFANGVVLDPINILRYTESVRGADRTVLEIVLDGAAYDYADIEALYDNLEALATVVITETNTDEEGNTTETDYQYNNFDLPVSLSKTKNAEYCTINLKISQKTVSEIQQEQLLQDSLDTQMAVIELAAMVAEMQTTQDSTVEEA